MRLVTQLHGMTSSRASTPGIALLIGMAGLRTTTPLEGVTRDLARIAKLLPRGYELRVLVGEEAVRATIVSSLEAVVADADGRPVVIYVSGHATLVEYRRQVHGLLVTNDHPRADGSMGGVLQVEITAAMARLTRGGSPVTMIADTCRTATTSSAPRAKWIEPRAWPWPADFFACHPGAPSPCEWFDALEPYSPGADPLAVLVHACALEQVAWECDDPDAPGQRCGLFTLLLERVLRAAVSTPTWLQAIAWVAARASGHLHARQRPEVVGAIARLALGSASLELGCHATVEFDEGVLELTHGRIHGASLDDRFVVDEPGAELRIIEVREARSRVDVVRGTRPAHGTLAVLRESASRVEVAIEGDTPAAKQLAAIVASSPSLACVERDGLLRVVPHAHDVTIHGVGGESLTCPIARLSTTLEACARAHRFAQVCETAPGLPGAARWQVRCMRRHAGIDTELQGGELLEVGDRVWYELVNDSLGSTTLYFNVVELRVDGLARVHNRDYAIAGRPTPSGHTRYFARELGSAAGHAIGWPSHTPADAIREFTIVVVVSLRPLELHAIDHRSYEREPQRTVWRGGALRRGEGWASRVLRLRLAPS